MDPLASPRKVVLTSRDYAVMKVIATNRFVSAKQLAHLWSNNPKNHNHYIRLKRLMRAGILELLIGDAGNRLGYRLTRKGIDLLPDDADRAKALAYRSFSYRTSFDHDRLLQELQTVFEQSPLVSRYMPEHEVRQRLSEKHGKKERNDVGYKVPDGLFELKTSRGIKRVAVELELTTKSESRYRKIFRELLTSSDFEIVLFVTASDKMTEALRSIVAEVKAEDMVVRGWPTKRGMYFATLESVLLEKQNAVFIGDSDPFSLASLEKSVSEKATGLSLPHPQGITPD